MKYAKIENNIVIQIQPNPEDGFIEVDDDVVCGMIQKEDGSFVNPVFEKTPEEIENERISEINSMTEKIITKPYPIYKQLNIRGQLSPYIMDDLEIMNMFIDTARFIGKDAKSNGTKPEDINWAGLDEYSSSDEITESDLLSIRKLVKAI